MKEKNKEALKELLETVKDHEDEDRGTDVLVDLEALKRLLRWSQDKAYVWLKGDRVKWTGVGLPNCYEWVTEDSVGTVYRDSTEEGTVMVEWDTTADDAGPSLMYHNEVKLAKP